MRDYIGPSHQLSTGLRPLALLETENLVRSFVSEFEIFDLPQVRTNDKGEPYVVHCRSARHYRETRVISRVHHPTALHRAVNDLFKTLVRERVPDNSLVTASLAIHSSDFGLVVYKHPRPGLVHIYNKKFGGRPIVLAEEPLSVERIRSAAGEFV